MKKYMYILIVVMLAVSISACGGGNAAATESPVDSGAPVDAGAPADSGAPADPGAAVDVPADPADAGVPDEMDGFMFPPMPGESEPKDDVNYFVAILREQSGINGDLQLITAVPATTTWETVLAYYDQQAKNNGWVLEKTEEVTTQKGYLCTVALFTHGNNKILIAYYPLNGEVNILQVQGQ